MRLVSHPACPADSGAGRASLETLTLSTAQKQRRRKLQRAWRAGLASALPQPPGLEQYFSTRTDLPGHSEDPEDEVLEFSFPEPRTYERIDDDDESHGAEMQLSRSVEAAARSGPDLIITQTWKMRAQAVRSLSAARRSSTTRTTSSVRRPAMTQSTCMQSERSGQPQ